MIRDIPKQKIF